MKTKAFLLFCLFCLGFLPIRTFAQCPDPHDRHCWNLQYMLYAAQTDFREFQPSEELSGLGLFPDYHRRTPASTLPNPDASFGEANVPCQVSAWLNGVAMYMCQGQVSIADAEQWYGSTLADLQQLQYLWQFKIESRGTDHYVDAGPPGCEVAPMDGPYVADGPYVGQCPLHLQSVKQPNGAAKVYLWLTSYSSPYLVARADSPARSSSQYLRASQSAPPVPASTQSSALSTAAPAPALADSRSSTLSTSPSPPALKSPPVAGSKAASSASAEPPAGTSQAPSSPSTSSASATALEPSPSSSSGCGDLCRDLKKILEDRGRAFRELTATSASPAGLGAAKTPSSNIVSTGTNEPSPAPSGLPLQLAGASSCAVRALPPDPTRSASKGTVSRVRLTPSTLQRKPASPATQYVCYWPEDSTFAAETRFRELTSLLTFLMPSNWSAHEETQTDELSGAKITVWSAHDAADRPAVGLYLSGQSVGLHVRAAN